MLQCAAPHGALAALGAARRAQQRGQVLRRQLLEASVAQQRVHCHSCLLVLCTVVK